MEKEFIPYEQALALKELGFDEPCFGAWVNNELFITENENPKIQSLSINQCTAPLYQQAFRFLREKYGLEDDFSMFNSYEEAELECLKKLIEIVNAKQVPVEPTGVTTQPYDESPHTKTFRTPASDFNSRGQYRK